MDDDASHSSDSAAVSEDYEIVGTGEPELQIAGNGTLDQLANSLKEILGEGSSNMEDSSHKEVLSMSTKEKDICDVADEQENKIMEDIGGKPVPIDNTDGVYIEECEKTVQELNDKTIPSRPNNFEPDGKSKGITSSLYTTSPSPSEDMQISQLSAVLATEGENTLFQVTYLGCAAINAPRSETEIQRNMAILNEQTSEQAIEITLSIPSHSEGSVVLYEPNSSNEMACFQIHRILFCARGRRESQEAQCFAFSCSHGSTAETAIFQCHVFKCAYVDDVVKVLQSFAAAFRRIPKLPSSRSNSVGSDKGSYVGTSIKNIEHCFVFEALLEFREEDMKGNFSPCPKDKDYFKFRCNLEKTISISVYQVSNNKELTIERCFGMLVSPGRSVKHCDMQLIEMTSMTSSTSGDRAVYNITGHWNPIDPAFEVLNTETPRDTRVYMTVAMDLVITGIQEPVRFVLETKAKVFQQNERFWYFTKKTLNEQFYLRLREVESEASENHVYDVVSLESASHNHRRRAALSLNLNTAKRSAGGTQDSTPGDQESSSDSEEPLLSGTGEVSKDCSEVELLGWAEVLAKWHLNLKQRPKQLGLLVHKGIPEALRGEAWQLLAGCHDDKEMMENYRLLITKESACENVIQRDINRTFPAHGYFKETGGIGQDSLYKICKAYSVHDPEIGYCQGLSFLAAALLLHMPEEQAFCVLVKIMSDFGLRDLFRNGFEELHLKFYQLERLMEDQMPELYNHFADLGIEAHMYGSQWFLTLFTAKFPLYVVFYILDLFLMDGMDTIFQVALALLQMSKKDLLALDFEGVLKYFRVNLPKRYRTEDSARHLLRTVVGVKIKKLKKYEKEFHGIKEQEKQMQDPVERLQKENKRLLESNMRLEQENDDLAHELVNSKIHLRGELDIAEDKAETLNKELLTTKTSLVEMEEEKRRLDVEVAQLKEMCRRELQRTETEIARNTTIISEYKQICSQLSKRLEKEQASAKDMADKLKARLSSCEHCARSWNNMKANPTPLAPSPQSEPASLDAQLMDSEKQVRELELELARTKLALVEAECKNQDLTHQLNTAITELQSSRSTWLQKTLTSIREVTRKELTGSRDGKEKDAL